MDEARRSRVVRPSWLWFLLLDGGIVVLARLVFSDAAYRRASELSKGALPPRTALRALLGATAVIHIGEAFAAGRMARRRGLPAAGWRLQTFIVGFPSLRTLRKSSSLQA
jgi:hypothetical protein